MDWGAFCPFFREEPLSWIQPEMGEELGVSSWQSPVSPFWQTSFLFSLGLKMGVWDLYLSLSSHYTHTHTRVHAHTHMLTCTHAHTHICSRAHTRAHTHTHTHTCSHTHTWVRPTIEPQAWLWSCGLLRGERSQSWERSEW